MIIWLASYPKSGNTWVRSIISSLIYTEDGIFDFSKLKNIKQFPEKKFFKNLINDFGNFNEIKKKWILAQEQINLDEGIKLFKTHQGKYQVGKDQFTNKDNTLAVIYIVRDPRNLVNSIANHYTLSINEACNFLLSPELIGNTKSWNERPNGMLTLLGKWNDHYRSWTRIKKNLLIIKYEDLISNTRGELEKIIHFLSRYLTFKTNRIKNEKILETTTFQNLKQMEKRGLFKEYVINPNDKNKVNFFHMGPDNNWKKSLDKKIINKIELNFNSEMKDLGYTD